MSIETILLIALFPTFAILALISVALNYAMFRVIEGR